ncbi:MAG: hypothetical protein NTX88_12430 [Candidatus Atribacteria bacterium]|nr:hypothetical protein [Candidatus Atribacteria bacterium]
MSRESYFHPLTVPGTDTVVSLLITIFSLYPLSAALGDYIIESDERYQHLTPMRILEGLPLRYLTQELRSILVSARIQKIVMTERRETWLQTYSSKGGNN